jgi:hypothetical protein
MHIVEIRPLVQQYRIIYKILVEQQEVTFEEDEEGHLRVLSDTPHAHHGIDQRLLEEIIRRIEEALYG